MVLSPSTLSDNQRALAALALAAAGLALTYAALPSRNKKREELRGTRKVQALPNTLPILLNTLDLAGNLPRMHDWNTENCLRFQGEPFVTRALGQPDMINVCTPQAIEDVLKNQFDAFPKGAHFCDIMRDLLGFGIFGVDGDKWVHQRKTASRLFTMRAMRDSMTESIEKHVVTVLDILGRQPAGQPMDFFKLFNRFTIEAFAEIGFGIQMNCLDNEEEHPFQTAFDGAQRLMALRFTRPIWFWKAQRWLGIGAEGQLKRHISVIDSTVLGIVTESLARRSTVDTTNEKKEAGAYKDIVSLFLDTMGTAPGTDNPMNPDGAVDESAEFDPMYLRDIVVSFLIAGRDTTAQALSWFFYNVAQHPEVERKIVEEVRAKLPGLMGLSSGATNPSMEEVAELTYLEATLRETLRLYPSVPFVNKNTARDVVLSDGTFVPKGSVMGIPFFAIGRLPFVWGEDAAEFKPERWIDPESGRLVAVPPSKFVAFNAGPRICLGMNLALLEMKLVAASILGKFHVDIVDPENVTYEFSLTLPIKGALMATVSPRREQL